MNRRHFFKGALALPALKVAAAETKKAPAAFPQSPGLTKYVAEFIVNTRFEEIPAQVNELAKKSILDGFGLALAGSVSAMGPLVRKYLESLGCTGGASVIGTSMKVPPRFAAFANGISIHADDYDDTQLSFAKDRIYGLLTHPTVPVLPPAFALAETMGKSGKDFLLAYQIGVEVECKIAEAISPRHYGDGFHSTGTIGPFGSVAACARLRGLTVEQTQYALGIAATEGGGYRNNFGSMTKPFHAGHAAEAGPVAADLAALGWTASPAILESPLAFFQAAGGGYDPSFIAGKLGKPWTFERPGVSIKPHPSGSLGHPAAGALLKLVKDNDVKPGDVEQVEVGGNHGMYTALFHHQPVNALQGKFSMEFVLAILLLERKAGLGEFTDEVVRRPDVQAMIKRIKFYVDPASENAGFDKMTSLIKIHLKGGKVLAGQADFAKGSPANPMSYEEVAEKFRGCADFAKWPSTKTSSVIATVISLERSVETESLATILGS